MAEGRDPTFDPGSIGGRMAARRSAIERSIHRRIDTETEASPHHRGDLQRLISVGVEVGLAAIEGQHVDRVVLARHCDLGAALRCLLVCHRVLDDHLVEACETSGPDGRADLARLRAAHDAHFDRLVAAYALEHGRASPEWSSSEQRRAEEVKRLLAGGTDRVAYLAYDLDMHHVGAVAAGPDAAHAIAALVQLLDTKPLVVQQEKGTLWAWCGRRRRPDLRHVSRLTVGADSSLAVGEVATGLSGWRRTHRQAVAAFVVARRRPGRPIRYADVAVVASMAQDDLLASSLYDLYLAPLGDDRDGGAKLRDTLRAYFASGRNGASTAAALNVSRQTVANRLRVVEERIGRPLAACGSSLDAALRLDELDRALPIQAGSQVTDVKHTVVTSARRSD